jgi:hypothetical protein
MTFVHKPSNRKDAKESFDFDEAHIGISGKRNPNRQLTIRHSDGKPFAFHPTYLTFNVHSGGWIYVNLTLFRYKVDKSFINAVGRLIDKNIKILTPTLALHHTFLHKCI